MKPREEYQRELEQIMSQLQRVEAEKQRLVNRGIELQGVLRELGPELGGTKGIEPEVKDDVTKVE